ncbi:MAG: DMSO reductase [Hyphomicrobiales bacterium]|nr:MAG: DMSO reductase [Hyphomicrobiales bacterium]
MHPAFSVIFLTVLMGIGQGIYLAMLTAEIYIYFDLLPELPDNVFYVIGSVLAALFLAGGLAASFAHLGRPERAWRAAAQWRTSWLSREVLLVPAVVGVVLIYGLLYFFDWNPVLIDRVDAPPVRLSLIIASLGTLLSFGLFVCTAMIYACVKFLQEWHSPLTVINYITLGGASGFVFTAAYASFVAPELTSFYGGWAIVITVVALITRGASLIRNARLRPKSSPQTAIGVHHRKIVQKTQGSMGGSFNTREFFHHRSAMFLKSLRWIFLASVFVLPIVLVGTGIATGLHEPFIVAFAIQFLGLLVERWYFFAEANHPQNIYYQSIA